MTIKKFHWECSFLPIDIIAFQSNLYACCEDGVYELTLNSCLETDLDFEDDDLFMESSSKKICQEPTEKIENTAGLLKVKFKRKSLAFSCFQSRNLVSLHQKNGREFYIEVTDLMTFNCKNPNLSLVTIDQKNSDKVWMMINDDLLAVHIFGSTFKGKFDGQSLDLKKCHVQTKLDLFIENVFHRPRIQSEKIIEKIIDELKIEKSVLSACKETALVTSPDGVCDINFVSHDLVLIVLNDGDKKGQLLQYQKNGKDVWKTEIPISHVSMTRKGLSNQGCLVMTTYGALYTIPLPYESDSECNQEINEQDPVKSILESSQKIRDFNAKKVELAIGLEQLKIALGDKCQLNHELYVDERKTLHLILSTEDHELYGQYWSIQVNIMSYVMVCPLQTALLKKKSKWTIKVPLDFEIGLSDLPVPIDLKMIFSYQNELKIELSQCIKTELNALHFFKVASTLFSSDQDAPTSSQDTFEDFLSNLNSRNYASNDFTGQSKSYSVMLNLKPPKENLVEFLSCDDKTIYGCLFDASLTLNVDKNNNCWKVAIRGKDLSYVLRLKKDLLARFDPFLPCKKSLKKVLNLIESPEDEAGKSSEKDSDGGTDQLDLCYNYLRQLS